MIRWQWCNFEELGKDELYALLQARLAVFCVEQECPYQDIDFLDQQAWHLIGWQGHAGKRALAAYARVVHPGHRFAEPSISRVLTTASYRGNGVGKQLMTEAINRTQACYPGRDIRISAQSYLEKFYLQQGFATVSAPYLEDEISHLEMLLAAR